MSEADDDKTLRPHAGAVLQGKQEEPMEALKFDWPPQCTTPAPPTTTPPHPTLIPPSPTVNEILPKTLGFVKSVPDLIRSDTATEFQAVVSVSGGRSVNHDTFYGGANIANKKFLSGGEREREKKQNFSRTTGAQVGGTGQRIVQDVHQ